MQSFTLISAVFGLTALWLFVRSWQRLRHRRLLSASGLVFSAIASALAAAFFLSLASNLYTYQRLTDERVIARVSFSQLQSQRFLVSITQLESGDKWQLELLGDEWQLDAQVLSWRGPATLLGLDAGYRLYRLTGRYQDISQARSAAYSGYSLLASDYVNTQSSHLDSWQMPAATLDIWQYAHQSGWLSGLVDALYGSAVFMPMADQAVFQVAISRTGLIARPVNKAARQASGQWAEVSVW